MIKTERFYQIRLKTSDMNKVVSVNNTLADKSFIEFDPVGIFPSDVDVKFKNPLLTSELLKAGVLFHTRPMIEISFYTARGSSYARIDEALEGSDKSTISVWDEFWKFGVPNSRAAWVHPANDSANPAGESDLSKIKLQRTKITEKKILNFKLEKPRAKWELIKALQEEFDKIPDNAEFRSFTAFGIGTGESRYL